MKYLKADIITGITEIDKSEAEGTLLYIDSYSEADTMLSVASLSGKPMFLAVFDDVFNLIEEYYGVQS